MGLSDDFCAALRRRESCPTRGPQYVDSRRLCHSIVMPLGTYRQITTEREQSFIEWLCADLRPSAYKKNEPEIDYLAHEYRVSLQSPFARGVLNNNLNRWNPNPIDIPQRL